MQRLFACTLASLLILAHGAAAQNPQPAPPGTEVPSVAPPSAPTPPPERLAPGARDGGSSQQSLSDKLSRQEGTLHPPSSVDPGIAVAPPPNSTGNMRVIPPPGSPGGNPQVVPK